jgi:molybdopterin molybdotransferase
MSVVIFTEARRIVEQRARSLKPAGSETVSLLAACNRVLAEPLLADRDFPPFARSIRDGYAVQSRDLASPPVRLKVLGEVKAGIAPEWMPRLQSGETAEIMTGAPLPPGADAVVMMEYTAREGDAVLVERGVSPGENVVPRGAEARVGDQLLAPGTCLEYSALGLAASVGRAELRVYAKPQVAILVTGDELVEITATPGPHQIRNSNSYSLAAQVVTAGADAHVLPVAPDEPRKLHELVADGLDADLLLVTGGVSVGKYDLVERALAELGAEFFFTGAYIQPGRPIVFGGVPLHPGSSGTKKGTAEDSQLTPCNPKMFFGLPGNPISAMVTFELFARPVIEALSGRLPRPLLFHQAILQSELKTKTGLTRFLPARLTGEFEHVKVEAISWQGSGDVAAAAQANCYLVIPPDRERIEAGEKVSVLLKR